MTNAEAKMNPQFWGECWNVLCRSWSASPLGSCSPHLRFAVGSRKKIGTERTLVMNVEYVNLCNDVFCTFMTCSVTTLRHVLYSLPKLPSGISPPTVVAHSNLTPYMSFLHFLISCFLCGYFLRLFPQWTTCPDIIVSQSVSGELNLRPLRWMSFLWPGKEKIIQPRDEGTELGKTRRCILWSLDFQYLTWYHIQEGWADAQKVFHWLN